MRNFTNTSRNVVVLCTAMALAVGLSACPDDEDDNNRPAVKNGGKGGASTGGSSGFGGALPGGAAGQGGATDPVVVPDAGGSEADAPGAEVEVLPPAPDASLCVPAAKRCRMDHAAVETCNADGSAWLTSSTCDRGCNDASHACQECVPGTDKSCSADEKILRACSGEGLWTPLMDCGAPGCDSGRKECRGCIPNAHKCDGANVQICDGLGKTSTTTACAGGIACDATKNDCPSCATPGETWCVGPVLKVCGADHTPQDKETCAFGCNDGLKKCNICMPSTKLCVANALHTCSADGAAETSEPCPAGCAGSPAACKPLLCAPSSKICQQDMKSRRDCNADGSSYTDITCKGGCSGSTCYAMCVPGEKLCKGDSLGVCKSDGSDYDLTSCNGKGCSMALRQCNFCEPGAKDCMATTLRTCSSDGTKFNTQDCTTTKPKPDPDGNLNGSGACDTSPKVACAVHCDSQFDLCGGTCLAQTRTGACGCLTCASWIDELNKNACNGTSLCTGSYTLGNAWTEKKTPADVLHNAGDKVSLKCTPNATKMTVNNMGVDCKLDNNGNGDVPQALCDTAGPFKNIAQAFCCEHRSCQ